VVRGLERYLRFSIGHRMACRIRPTICIRLSSIIGNIHELLSLSVLWTTDYG
jgi:hypothetical protein